MCPKLYLCIDNCFASKRWTLPLDWMNLIKDIGLNYVEASADTECDPLYMDSDYLDAWIRDVKNGTEKTGVSVAKLFSGHGTYATLGLTHTDDGARVRFRDKWIKPHADTARALNAGIGFFAHGIDESVLQDSSKYKKTINTLYEDLADIANYAAQIGLSDVGIEQMYSPHQPPWTISGTKELLTEVYSKYNSPMYITLDLGHMNGQQYFLKPTKEYLLELFENNNDKHLRNVWVGSRKARSIFDSALSGNINIHSAVTQILEDAEENPHLFAEKKDTDIYGWISNFGCYSPIMHLQQSDGKSSPHWPFSKEKNSIGVIDGKKVIKSIAESYSDETELVPKCDSIYLTLEPFISTSGNVYDAVYDIKQSVDYWRQFVPYDGITLDEAMNNL